MVDTVATEASDHYVEVRVTGMELTARVTSLFCPSTLELGQVGSDVLSHGGVLSELARWDSNNAFETCAAQLVHTQTCRVLIGQSSCTPWIAERASIR